VCVSLWVFADYEVLASAESFSVPMIFLLLAL